MYWTLRCFTSWPVPLVSRLTTLFLNARSLSRSIVGSPNSTPHAFACRASSMQLRDVQQRLRRNAAAVDADAARVRLGIDERDAQPEIGGEERRGVASRPAADDDKLVELIATHPRHEGTKARSP